MKNKMVLTKCLLIGLLVISFFNTSQKLWAGSACEIDNATTITISNNYNQSETAGDNDQSISDVYGVYIHPPSTINRILIKRANINASGTVQDAVNMDTEASNIYGLYITQDVSQFTNVGGNISANGMAGDAIGGNLGVNYVSAIHVDMEKEMYDFHNRGIISAHSTIGDVIGDEIDANIDTVAVDLSGKATIFQNFGPTSALGKISAVGRAGDCRGEDSIIELEVSAINFDNGPKTFWNYRGVITATATAGDAIGENGEISLFVNGVSMLPWPDISRGSTIYFEGKKSQITATAKVGNAIGDNSLVSIGDKEDDAFGVIGLYVRDNEYTTCFESCRGSATTEIKAIAEAGNAIGDSSTVAIYGIAAYAIKGENRLFLQHPTLFETTVTVGDATGDNSGVYVEGVYGMYQSPKGLYNIIDSMSRYNIFKTTVTTGGAYGKNSVVSVNSVASIFIQNHFRELTNYGYIITIIDAGRNALIGNNDYIAGVWLKSITDPININNHGTISLDIFKRFNILSQTPTSVNRSAAIVIEDCSNVTLNNSGYIYLFTNVPNENIRALWIDNSNVTLGNSEEKNFSITFGSVGTTKRPIYLKNGSTLNLNNATLIARIDADLRINTPYYIIENNNSTVNNTFGGLKKGYSNPDITVSWFGEDRGENAAVIFKFAPGKHMSSQAIYSSLAVLRSQISRLSFFVFYKTGRIFTSLPQQSAMFQNKLKPFKVASASYMIPVPSKKSSPEYRSYFYILPLYTRIEAGDLGYDSNMTGLQAGYERALTNNFSLGFSAGWARNDLKFTETGYRDSEEHQYIYNIGGYGIYNLDNWYGAMFVSYHNINHSYKGKTGPDMDWVETDYYDTWAISTKAIGGYRFNFKKGFTLMPICGFSYYYLRTGKHTTNVESDPDWEKHYKSNSEDFFRVIGGINAIQSWNFSNVQWSLFGGLSIERAIGGNDIDVVVSIPGMNVNHKVLKTEVSDTSVVGHLGLNATQGRTKIEIVFETEQNSDYKTYSGYLSFGVKF